MKTLLPTYKQTAENSKKERVMEMSFATELQETIKKMMLGKAPGLDEITPEAVKETVKTNAK